jgi:hypothetical protein
MGMPALPAASLWEMVDHQAKDIMSDAGYILCLIALAALVGFLLGKCNERSRKRSAPPRPLPRVGNVINVAPLRPRLEELRRDYSSAAHAHERGIEARESLVAAARSKLTRLPFFQKHPATPDDDREAA